MTVRRLANKMFDILFAKPQHSVIATHTTKGTKMQVAQTILQQLGGNRFVAMTGAKNMTADSNTLTMRLPSNFARDGINHVAIRLEPSDTYSIRFNRVRGMSVKAVSEHTDVYCDMLRDLFEAATGLRTSL